MAGLQKRGSIPEAPPLPSSRSMNAEFQVLELEIPQELAGRAAGQRTRAAAAGAFSHPHQGLDRGRASSGRAPGVQAARQGGGRCAHTADARRAGARPRGARRGDPARCGLRGRGCAGDRQTGRPGGAPGRRQSASHAAKCPAGLGSGAWRRCPEPASFTGSTRTPAGCWWSRARPARTRRCRASSWPATVAREYLAICVGVMTGGGTVDEPIGRHRSDRLRMAIRSDGRPARTHYRVLERFRAHTYLKVKLDTGRTHQIRVHLAHLKHPMVGDPVYGGRLARPRGPARSSSAPCAGSSGKRLHAAALAFDHPVSGERLSFEAPLPADFAGLLAALRADARGDAANAPLGRGSEWRGWLPDWPAPPEVRALSTQRCGRRERGALRVAQSGRPRRGCRRGGRGESPPAASRRRPACGTVVAIAGARRRCARLGRAAGAGRRASRADARRSPAVPGGSAPS